MKKMNITQVIRLPHGVFVAQIAASSNLFVAIFPKGRKAVLMGIGALALLPGFTTASQLDPVELSDDERSSVHRALLDSYMDLIEELGIIV